MKLVPFDSEEGRAIRRSSAYLEWCRTEWSDTAWLASLVFFGGGTASALHYLGVDKYLVLAGSGFLLLVWIYASTSLFHKQQKELFGLVKT